MDSILTRAIKVSALAGLLATTACGPTATAEKKLPDGEDALSCAALIFAATNLVEGDEYKADLAIVKDSYLSTSTYYGTAVATEKAIDAQAALGLIKLKAYKMAGTTSVSNDTLSSGTIAKRAKACTETA